MSREKQNNGDVGKRGMTAYCPKCGRSFESISYDSKTDTCTCVCGWTNSIDSEEQIIAKQIDDIAKYLCKNYSPYCSMCPDCYAQEEATALYKAGYRRQSQNATDINVGNKSEWISVDERLPEPNKLVLCLWERIGDGVCYGFARYQRENVWYVSNEGMPRVTHWMPLPEPPKVKGGAE